MKTILCVTILILCFGLLCLAQQKPAAIPHSLDWGTVENPKSAVQTENLKSAVQTENPWTTVDPPAGDEMMVRSSSPPPVYYYVVSSVVVTHVLAQLETLRKSSQLPPRAMVLLYDIIYWIIYMLQNP